MIKDFREGMIRREERTLTPLERFQKLEQDDKHKLLLNMQRSIIDNLNGVRLDNYTDMLQSTIFNYDMGYLSMIHGDNLQDVFNKLLQETRKDRKEP